MAWTDLVPWARNNRSVTSPRFGEENDPFLAFHRGVNRMLDDFARSFGDAAPARFGSSGAWPRVEVSETDKEVKVTAELPGMEQKDIDVSLHDGVLTLRGEKKAETEGPAYSERWHGQFQRSLQVGPDVDPEQVSANFRNGVLTVTMSKRPEAQRQVKRIPINA